MTEASPAGAVSALVEARRDSFTRTEMRIAQVLLARYPLPGLETLVQFAEKAHASPATTLRFVNKLGFDGYAEFQEAIRAELQPQLSSPLTRSPNFLVGPEVDADASAFVESVIANVERAFTLMPAGEFRAIVDLLANTSRPVVCLGGRFSRARATSLADLLAELRPRVTLVEKPNALWPVQLLDMGKTHVLLVFDYRRYQDDVIAFSQAAADQGSTVVLFTDEWMSPISRFADYVMTSPVAVRSMYDSTIAAEVQIEAIVAALGRRLGDSAVRRMEDLERLRVAAADPRVRLNGDRPSGKKPGAPKERHETIRQTRPVQP